LVAAFLVGFLWLFWGLPNPSTIDDRESISTKLFDRHGTLIYEIYADKRRSPISLNEIPDYVKQATIAVEDKDFYQHKGFSITGIARAAYKTIFKQNLQGGSTLTQQLVKTTLLSPERTLRRKIRELVLTLIVETRYSKDQILTMYLNQIPYGGTAYGIEAAAELYFDKAAKDLTLSEAALLSGLLASPSHYSPFGSQPELARERQLFVLSRMVEEHYITQEQADQAKDAPLVFGTQKPLAAPHFVLWIKDQLAEKYGEAVTEKGGLRVTTTLDLDLQNYTQDAVATEVGRLKKQHVGNGAALVTIPPTGEILAMVGSKDYFSTDEDGKVNVLFAKRQPGSSIKPFNYAMAIRDGKITASTALADVPTCFSSTGQTPYCPKNYDGTFHGLVQTRFALGNSLNIPAVRILALNGIPEFIDFATQLGITTFEDPKNYGLSLTLGGGEVRPVDMAVAFGVFANEGIKQPLWGIQKVEDWKGNVLEEHKTDPLTGDRVLDAGTAFIISQMLFDNNARTIAFGPSSYLNVSGHPEVSVKTGTTNDRRDNWTIGYTPHILALTWVGNNDNSEMSGAVSGVSGASPIWNKSIKFALDRAEKGDYSTIAKGKSWPQQPDTVVGKMVCATTGSLPEASQGLDCPQRFEYFLEDHLPSPTQGGFQDIQIDRSTQTVSNSKTLPENLATENRPVYYDPLGTLYCLTCAIPSEAVTLRYPLVVTSATPR
jgi:penicillin-binding protein 1C